MDELNRHVESLAPPGGPQSHEATARISGAEGYRSYAGLATAWSALQAAGVRARVIGRSVRGVPLFALEIGPEEAEHASVLIAGMHPIEWIGVEVGLALLVRLARNPPAGRRVIGFPLVNVDGYRQVEADLRRGRRRFRRSNANGVDLNRNWPTHFRPGRGRSRLHGWNQGGPRPLSEPEIAAVASTCDEIARRATIDLALSLHGIGRMVLYPFGGRWAPPSDVDRERAAAEALCARMPERYRARQSARWVPGAFAYGMELDHMRARYGATSLLVECTLGGIELRRPWSLFEPFRWFNPRDPVRVANALADALEPFVRGELVGEAAR